MKLVATILVGLLGYMVLIGIPSARVLRSRRHAPPKIERVAHVPAVDRVPAVWTSDDVELSPPAAPPVAKAPVVAVAKPAVPSLQESDIKAALESRILELGICRLAGAERGRAKAFVKFAPSGAVDIQLESPYAGTATGACIARRLTSVAAPYQGSGFVAEVPIAL